VIITLTGHRCGASLIFKRFVILKWSLPAAIFYAKITHHCQ
jgi:hypothetical protein